MLNHPFLDMFGAKLEVQYEKIDMIKKYILDKKILLIIISIIILSFLLRIYDLGGESLWYDESSSIYNANKPILSIVLDKPYYILYHTVLHFWIELFGDSEFSIRFPSVIFGVLSVYMIYKLGELIFDTNIGLLSSFMLSISLYHIRYSQEARSYSLLVLLALLSNYYFIKILENKDRKHIIGYILSSITMVYTHGYGLFYLIFQNIYYIFKRKEIKLKMWLTIQCIISSFFILWLLFLLRNIEILMKRDSNVLQIPTFSSMYGVLQIPTFSSIYGTFKIFAGSEQILYIFIAVIIIGLIIYIINDYNKNEIYKYIFLVLWLLIPFIMSYIISYTVEPLYHNRYLIASFPAMILLFSKGIYNFRNTKIILFILLIVTALQIPLIEGYYQDVRNDQWREAANYIENIKGDSDIILLYPEFTKVVFGYYSKKDLNYIGINRSFDINSINNERINRIWLIYSHMQYKERKNELYIIDKELIKTYNIKGTINFYGIKIDEYNKKYD